MSWLCNKDCENRTPYGYCELPFCTKKQNERYMIIPSIMLEALYKKQEQARQKCRTQRKSK